MRKLIAVLCAAMAAPFVGVRLIPAANIAAGRHKTGDITRLADAVITDYFLLGKVGTDDNHVNVCGANDVPVYSVTDAAAAIEDPINCHVLGSGGTDLGVASGQIAQGAEIYTAALGKVSTISATPGTYYRVGRALTTAADGELLEYVSCIPVGVTVS